MSRIIVLALFFGEKFISYLLMLLAMTFNGYVILSIALGLTIGYNFALLPLDLEIFGKNANCRLGAKSGSPEFLVGVN